MHIVLPMAPILMGEINFTSSKVGSSSDLAEMLDFCSQYNITSKVEKIFELDQVQEAIDEFKDKGFHYRAIIKIPQNDDEIAKV
jgi:D-arabinose 1-dehydrogenase-like Zn-dependent alcohol dehydrogenase